MIGPAAPVFVASFVLLAAGVITACVRLLPRTGGDAAAHVLARAGLVVVGQAVLATAILVLLNTRFEFFASWSDLLGTDNRPATVVGAATARAPVDPSASMRAGHDALTAGVPARDGRLDSVVIHGSRSGLAAPGYVYLPPQYFRTGRRHRRPPVVLVLTGDVRGTIDGLRLPEIVAGRVAAGALRPAVYVVLRPTSCVDAPGGRQEETLFAQDVPMAVSGAYHVARDGSGWGVLGDAAGGYCAAKLAIAHSDRFMAGAVAARAYTAPAGDLYDGSAAIHDENDLVWRLRHRPSPPARLICLVPPGGEAGARTLSGLARPPMMVQTMALTGGGALTTWRRDLPAVLRRLTGSLSPETTS